MVEQSNSKYIRCTLYFVVLIPVVLLVEVEHRVDESGF